MKAHERLRELLKEFDSHPEKTCPQFNTGKSCEGCKYFKNQHCDIDGRRVDFLLANGVIVPPCKVGDIVKHDAIYYRVYRAETYSDFETPIHHRYWTEPINEEGEDDFWFWSDRVEEGTVVVCSKEEAEKALQGK